MNILLLNGSPKAGEGASKALLEALRDRIGSAHTYRTVYSAKADKEQLLEQAQGCEAIVLAFPLYVDGLPSHLLRLLDEVRREIRLKAPDATVYAVVNNGFYEARQNQHAIEMIRHFCAAAGLRWGRGLGVGGGPMSEQARIGYGPMKRAGSALDTLAENIRQKTCGDPLYALPNFPRALYVLGGNLGWPMQAKRNGVSKKALYAKR